MNGNRLLVIAPHADDETIGCGGLIARMASEGATVGVRLVTAGDVPFLHTNGTVVPAESRQREFERAMAVLGDVQTDTLFPTRGHEMYLDTIAMRDIVDGLESKGELSFREFQPDIVALPLPGYHQDHRAVYEAGFAACRIGSSHIVPTVLGYEEPNANWNPSTRYEPTLYVDVTASIDLKLSAMKLHVSQSRDPDNPFSVSSLREWARMRGRQVGVEYAEAFVVFRQTV